jgi:hypothetical protein
MKRLGLISAIGLLLGAAPSAALATGWGAYTPPRSDVAPVPPAYSVPVARVYVAPSSQRYLPAPARVWVPGHWGLRGDKRSWVSGKWTFPPFAGWVWITPRSAWNGQGWVSEEGQWAPPVRAGY